MAIQKFIPGPARSQAKQATGKQEQVPNKNHRKKARRHSSPRWQTKKFNAGHGGPKQKHGKNQTDKALEEKQD